ncbi:MAG TPA: nuclear transport factor 2 family protein [Terriglobales bacterium]|nr:nuclear transport factor 2 family protein [Terriglobales bacterium]
MKPKILVLLLWILSSITGAAQDSTKVVAMENAWNQAELKNDASAVQLLLADDFIMTTAEGELYNKAQIVASIREKSYEPDVLQSSDMVVHAHGNTAVVTGMYLEKGTDKGKPWERRGRFTDTWMFKDNRWQCIASHFSIKPK